MNCSLVFADWNTHLKIVAVAFVCSLLAALAFHASTPVSPVSKKFMAVQILADGAHPTVCRINEL